jgi:hypothetical protein
MTTDAADTVPTRHKPRLIKGGPKTVAMSLGATAVGIVDAVAADQSCSRSEAARYLISLGYQTWRREAGRR